MKYWKKALWVLAVSFSVGTVQLAITSCTTPIKNDTEVSGFGVTVKTTTQLGGEATDTFSGSLPAGKCLRTTYRGSDGAVTGTEQGAVPGSAQIPPGSVSHSFEIVDCEPPEPDPDPENAPLHQPWPGGTPQSASRRVQLAEHLGILPTSIYTEIFGGPIVLDTVDGGMFKNAVYKFRVMNAGPSAWDEILPILLGGPGSPVSGNIDVISFTQTIPHALGARLIAADTSTFTEFRLDWNNAHAYADLTAGHNVVQYTAPNNWNVVETFISALDILPFGQQNVATTTRMSVGENSSASITAKVLYYP